MISAVLDTNILASGALKPSSIPGQILKQWRDDKFELIISQHILSELEETLNKSYFRNILKTQDIDDFLELLLSEAILTLITTTIQGVATHPEDDLVLATAESGKASFVVTGDHGLQNLKQFKNIKIVSPSTFSEILHTEKAA
ncbi:MAG: putative toxin-antitoxin system toxin component, PIN family [Candidatus Levybacteria bacterium RIFCSPLOWO2_02_FULL_37_10]|nr:MAG: putative toxin-antitoxin system toxin component, PIN family [Candidatus Levybacteria bacterium RIFCSPHIGHO2_01_FULL_37_33]OGH32462.1 MAG: putative toxin-antitoxin system toxin component, PIN family [Candidatus Levybacteria bacterium RIFCSPLOWO2_01_FULL_36_54]OGH45806.1 MAG: putative toxin-antitoxin system toxin component, PIN family [Candidatus Levybacteria bacterium RIFCSPLOWO2_02_FULL_37_10]